MFRVMENQNDPVGEDIISKGQKNEGEERKEDEQRNGNAVNAHGIHFSDGVVWKHGRDSGKFVLEPELLEEIKGRKKLKRFVKVMVAIESVLAILLLIMSSNKLEELRPVFKVYPNALLRSLFGQTFLIAAVSLTFTFLTNNFGIELVNMPLETIAHRCRKMWIVLTVLFVAVVSFHALIFSKVLETGSSEVAELLHQGMTSYLEEPNWKRCFDKLHQAKRCCGVFGVDDWLSARWLTLDHLQNQTPDKLSLVDDDGSILGKTLPASCCSPYARQPCVHDLLQQQHNMTVVGTKIRPPEEDVNRMSFYSSVYLRGCAPALLQPIQQDAVLFNAIFILTAVLHVSTTLMGEYLYVVGQKTALKVGTFINTMDSLVPKETHPRPKRVNKTDNEEDILGSICKWVMTTILKAIGCCILSVLILLSPLMIIILPIIIATLLPVIMCILLPIMIFARFWQKEPGSTGVQYKERIMK